MLWNMLKKIHRIAELKISIEADIKEMNRITKGKYEHEFRFMINNLDKVVDTILDKEIEEITK